MSSTSGVTASSTDTPAAPATSTPAAAPATGTATPTPSPETSASPAAETSPTPSQPPSEEEALKAASRLRLKVKITGRVLDANRVGIANATVILISPTGMVLTATTDNDEGNYSFMVAAPSTQNLSHHSIERRLHLHTYRQSVCGIG